MLSYAWLYFLYRLAGYERIEERLQAAHEKNAARLLAAILRLRAVYIKLGQVLSVLGGILPAVFTDHLAGLQDAVPPHPYKDILRRWHDEFGRYPGEMGIELTHTPLASASLGQVHRAKDSEGRDLAVKIQYPGIERIVEMDLQVISRITRILDWAFPSMHYHRIKDQVVDVIRRELDYRSEAENLHALAANFAGDPDVIFPEIIPEYSSARVLCMSYMEGIKIGDRKALIAAGINPSEVAKKLSETFFKQLLKDRLFHADPHPGNFLVRPGPQLVFLDFGAVEPVREPLMRGMAKVFMGYISKNDELVIDGIETMGFKSLSGDREVFERAIKHYFDKILRLDPKDMARPQAGALRDFADPRQANVGIRELARAFEYPQGYFYIERSLFLLLGLCLNLDRHVDPLAAGAPYAMEFLFKGE